MSNERNEPPTNLQALWQSQPVEARRFSLEEIRAKATRFQRTVRFRNLREYVAAIAVLIIFSWYAWSAETRLSRVGHGLIVLGTLYVVFLLYSRAASQPVSGVGVVGGVVESCIAFHRRELERQRDLLRTVWRWYLGPLIPGLLVLFVERVLEASAKGSSQLPRSLGSAGVSTLIFVGIGWLNAVGARRLQREIDALHREQGGEQP